jgi:hypothetical protein
MNSSNRKIRSKNAKFSVNSKGDSKGTDQDKFESDKKDPCGPRKCSSYGHIRVDCGNLKQSKGKAFNATLSDDSNCDETPGKDSNYLAIATSYGSPHESNKNCYENSGSEDEQKELQRVYNKVFVKFSELREVNKQHVKKLNEFEIERSRLIEKVKCLEDELIESQRHLEKKFGDKFVQMLKYQKCLSDKSGLGFHKFVVSSSHVASTSKTVFVKPEIYRTHIACLDKGKNDIIRKHVKAESQIPIKKQSKSKFIHTCFNCCIISQTRPYCLQIYS